MKAQIGSKNLPVLLTPRIGGSEVTVTQIKTLYSEAFLNDTDTPMTFWLEYSDILGNKVEIEFDPERTSDILIYYPIPDALYVTPAKFSILFYWLVSNIADPPVELEKIYVEQANVLEIQDLHNDV